MDTGMIALNTMDTEVIAPNLIDSRMVGLKYLTLEYFSSPQHDWLSKHSTERNGLLNYSLEPIRH